ncbi:MAG: hypothetical protein QNJ06_13085 [Kiloniellales bacterium]|nr:hypothetical protein [Kiloniellales bacterium]MDJ0970822.1 hypothetical protein [Kiloniellales bacterium]MDJ0982875.1 hypothetical protein [Kiloniellales bacterium]
MQDFDNAVQQAEEQIRLAQSKTAAVTEAFAESKVADSETIPIDIENASLQDVEAHNEAMNANIAELIIGLDEVTAGFSKEFEAMRDKTGWETMVGWFSSAKADSLRAERIRVASIDDNLQDLISKSDVIVAILDRQLASLSEQKGKVEERLEQTLAEREQAVAELEGVRAELQALDPKIIDLENRISMATDPAERTQLETELASLNARHNELVQSEQVTLARSQTLEKYIEKGKTWVDSLQNQAATQMVLINKLQTDTKQRVVLYDALTKSLKTAQQQEVAHRINEIGSQTDKEAQAAMAAIGAATQSRIADMMEAHEDNIVFARKVLEEKAKADDRFARRFAKVVEKHDKNLYGQPS